MLLIDSDDIIYCGLGYFRPIQVRGMADSIGEVTATVAIGSHSNSNRISVISQHKDYKFHPLSFMPDLQPSSLLLSFDNPSNLIIRREIIVGDVQTYLRFGEPTVGEAKYCLVVDKYESNEHSWIGAPSIRIGLQSLPPGLTEIHFNPFEGVLFRREYKPTGLEWTSTELGLARLERSIAPDLQYEYEVAFDQFDLELFRRPLQEQYELIDKAMRPFCRAMSLLSGTRVEWKHAKMHGELNDVAVVAQAYRDNRAFGSDMPISRIELSSQQLISAFHQFLPSAGQVVQALVTHQSQDALYRSILLIDESYRSKFIDTIAALIFPALDNLSSMISSSQNFATRIEQGLEITLGNHDTSIFFRVTSGIDTKAKFKECINRIREIRNEMLHEGKLALHDDHTWDLVYFARGVARFIAARMLNVAEASIELGTDKLVYHHL